MFTTEIHVHHIRKGLENVRAAGRTEIRYEVYDEEGNDAVQTITVEQAEMILPYLERHDLLYFAGLDESGLPMFGSSFDPEESTAWDELNK